MGAECFAQGLTPRNCGDRVADRGKMRLLFVALMLLASSPAFAFVDCTSPAFGKHIEDQAFECQVAREATFVALGRAVQVRTVIEASDPYGPAFVDDVMKAANSHWPLFRQRPLECP